MKRSKLLIPALSLTAIAPVIVLSSCNQTSTEQTILDCITKPLGLDPSPVADFESQYKAMSSQDKQKELIYDAFGLFNLKNVDNKASSLMSLWSLDHQGSFKVNVAACEIGEKDGQYLANLRGYISYIFEKEHTYNPQDYIEVTMKPNDYVMITFEFINIPVMIQDYYLEYQPVETAACLGFQKIKYESGQKDMLLPIGSITTQSFQPKNSKNWVKPA